MWKYIDKYLNNLAYYIQPNEKWLTYSWLKYICGYREMRADYIDYTSNRYAANVRAACDRGYIPIDWNETKPEYFRKKFDKLHEKDLTFTKIAAYCTQEENNTRRLYKSSHPDLESIIGIRERKNE